MPQCRETSTMKINAMKLIPISLLSWEELSYPTRILLVYSMYGDPDDNEYCRLPTHTVCRMIGLVDAEGKPSTKRMRNLRDKLVRNGSLAVRTWKANGHEGTNYKVLTG